MARYKPYDSAQTKSITVSYGEQILPGTFEYALSELVDKKLDLGIFAGRYRNDDTGFEKVRCRTHDVSPGDGSKVG